MASPLALRSCKLEAPEAYKPLYGDARLSISTALFAVLVWSAGFFAAPVVEAQSREAEDTAIARALFQEGVAFADRGEWAQAADRFERTLALRYSPAVAFNLAAAQIHLGRYVAASELLRRILRDENTSGNVRAAARARQRAIAPRIGRLTVVVEGLTPDLEIRLDGANVPHARLGVAAPEDPGPHRVEAVRRGQVVASNTTTLPSGGSSQLRLDVPAVVSSAPSEASPLSPVAVARANVADPDEEDTFAAPQESIVVTDTRDEEPALTERWWFWAGVSAVVVVGTVSAILIANSGDDDIVEGDFMPGVVEL